MSARPTVGVPDDVVRAYEQSPDLHRLRTVAAVQVYPSRPADQAELSRRTREADVILSFTPHLRVFLPHQRVPEAIGQDGRRLPCHTASGSRWGEAPLGRLVQRSWVSPLTSAGL